MDPKKPGITLKNVFTTMRESVPTDIKLSEEAKTEMLEQTRRFVAFFTAHACNNATSQTRKTVSHYDVVTAFRLNIFDFQQHLNAQVIPSVEQQQRDATIASQLFAQQGSELVPPPLLMDQPSFEFDDFSFNFNKDTTPQAFLLDAPASSSTAIPHKRKHSEDEIIREIEVLKMKVEKLENAESARTSQQEDSRNTFMEVMKWLTRQAKETSDNHKSEVDGLKRTIENLTASVQGNAGSADRF